MMNNIRFRSKCTGLSKIDYAHLNQNVSEIGLAILKIWLPTGRIEGRDYVALNPTRRDRNLGSFRINHQTGKWIDFATGDKGGDFISLGAYLQGLKQHEAALLLTRMLGENHEN